jgi:uncharacterized membrane-anchored protein
MIVHSTLLFLGGIGGWEILLLSSLLIPLLLWIVALVDCLKSEFKGNDKVIWVIVILFFPVVGPILYFIIGRGQKV